jgi:hypothetical protein
MGTRWDILQFISDVTASTFAELLEDAAMPRVKRASKQKRTAKSAALTVLGAGLSFSLVGNASASTLPAADIPQADNNWSEHRFVLNEEEMADVNLATFHLIDREHDIAGFQQMAWRGCRGCRVVRRACGVGWGVGCGGCGGCGGCCAAWGRCRWC